MMFLMLQKYFSYYYYIHHRFSIYRVCCVGSEILKRYRSENVKQISKKEGSESMENPQLPVSFLNCCFYAAQGTHSTKKKPNDLTTIFVIIIINLV
jgi:hypothetical protein